MKNANLHYIYSKSAAQRMFEAEVKKVQIYTNCIFVVFEEGQGLRPRFVSKNDFKRHFAEYRKASARQVHVSYHPFSGNFRAPSSHNMQECYSIELWPESLQCSCGDWKNQEEIGIATPMCKHCYAVLDYIGCNSLADYVERKGCEFIDHQETLHEYDDPLKDWHDELMAQENYLW